MRLVNTTLFFILIGSPVEGLRPEVSAGIHWLPQMVLWLRAASPAFSLSQQSDQTVGVETNYKEVKGFSGYLTLDDDPREKIKRWLDPVEIETLSAMATMKRGKTMGAFVELRGCKQNAPAVCNVRVNYTIHKPDGSILVTRAVGQRELIWKKQAPPAPHRSNPKSRNSSMKQRPKMGIGTASNRSKGLARMYFKLGKDDPVGEYKVKAKVTDLNADISFELELSFYLKLK